jgi:hypothetical protein
MIGTGDGDPGHASFISASQDVIGHGHILVFIIEVIERIARAAFITQMHHRIDAVEQMGVLAAVGVNQVGNGDIVDALTSTILRLDVNEDELIALPECG